MFLYFIRHGQSFVNLPDWDGGNLDTGLTPLGHAQAEALAQWLPTHLPHIDQLYSSTMRRARETAQPISAAYQKYVQYDDRVREIGNNQRSHDPFPNDDLPLHYADFWSSERPFAPVISAVENAEAMIHFRARVGMFVEDLVQKHQGEKVVVVCHGGVVDMAFDHIFDTGVWRRCEVWTKNTAVTTFEYVAHPRRETWRLHYHNRTDHYQFVPAELWPTERSTVTNPAKQV
jgi:broad specificity phosphatase PhoE